MGRFGDWIRKWKAARAEAAHKRRVMTELAALDHLIGIIEKEKSTIAPLETSILEARKLVQAGKFQEAENWIVGEVIPRIAQKKYADKIEEKDFKMFKKTLLKDLKGMMQQLR